MFVDATSTNHNLRTTLLMNSNTSSDPDLARLLAAIAKIPPVSSKNPNEANFSSDTISGNNFDFSSFTPSDWQSQNQNQTQTQVQTLHSNENASMFFGNSSNANMSSILSQRVSSLLPNSSSQLMSNFQSSSFNDPSINNSIKQSGNWNNASAPATQILPSLSNNSNVTSNMSLSRLLEGQEILSMRGKNFSISNNSQTMRGDNRHGLEASQLVNASTNNNNSNNNKNNNNNSNPNSTFNSFFQATSPTSLSILNSPSPNETPAPVKMEIKNIISQLLAEKQANGQLGFSIASPTNSAGSVRTNTHPTQPHSNHPRAPIPNEFNPPNLNETSRTQSMGRPSPPPPPPNNVPSAPSLPQQPNPSLTKTSAGSAPNLDANAMLQIVISTLSKSPKTPEDAIQQQKILDEIDFLTRDLIEKQIKVNGKSSDVSSLPNVLESMNFPALSNATNPSMPPSISSPSLPCFPLPAANSSSANASNHELANNSNMNNSNNNINNNNNGTFSSARPVDNFQKSLSNGINELNKTNANLRPSPNQQPFQTYHAGSGGGETSTWNLESLINQTNPSLFSNLQNSNSPANLLKRKSVPEPVELVMPKRELNGLESFFGKENIDVEAFVSELLKDSPRYPSSLLSSDAFRRLAEMNMNQTQGMLDMDTMRSTPLIPLSDDVDRAKPTNPSIGDGPPSKRICTQVTNTIKEEVAETENDTQNHIALNDLSKLTSKVKNEPNQEDCNELKIQARNSPLQHLSNRQRRESINTRLKELEQLIPGGNSMDPGTLLEAVLHHVKQLQVQLQILNQEEYNNKGSEDNR